MRDLKAQELTHVYGAGGRGKRCAPKKKHGKRRGSGSGSNGNRGGSGSRGRKGGSS